ncbi:hypothetical protein SDC9_65619 [bioreactor metagenome]|uniref:Uncharacterized protein n=1 Tax=bioreactor metagenome TaxID=1076179 RepID=A0A644XTW4_9ZZZZ
MLGNVVLDELVRAETGAATLAVHQRVGKAAHMAAGDPGFRVHEDRRVHTDVIGRFLHELAPPCALDVVFEFHAQRAVIPGVRETAVDLAAGVNKTAPLAQGDDLIHCKFLCRFL